jgi:hypothetical protein
MKKCVSVPLLFLVLTCAFAIPEDRAPNVRLFEWERGYGVESHAQKGMAVYLWFYEWNMFEAMQPGQHTQGTYRLDRKLRDDSRQGVISSNTLTLRVTATTDGADLELTVRNTTGHDFPPHAAIIPCFNPGPEESRNIAFANTNTYFLGPEGLEKLVRRQIHFSAALRKLVDRDATDGRYAWSDKWPLAEPNAAGGIIARESTDGKWACGIAWENFLSAQGHNPWQCMHLSVCVGPLKRGQSKSIRGKIYLLHGSKDDVLRRYRDDFGRTTRAVKAQD